MMMLYVGFKVYFSQLRDLCSDIWFGRRSLHCVRTSMRPRHSLYWYCVKMKIMRY